MWLIFQWAWPSLAQYIDSILLHYPQHCYDNCCMASGDIGGCGCTRCKMTSEDVTFNSFSSRDVTIINNKYTHLMPNTVHGKILAVEKLANCELFAKIFITNIHRYTENVFDICTNCSLFVKFFLAKSFCQYGSPKFYHVWYKYIRTYLCYVKDMYVLHNVQAQR